MTGRQARAALAGLALIAGACGGGSSETAPPASPAVSRNPAPFVEGQAYEPQIDPADFVEVIDNPYLPLVPGTTRVYEGVSDGERERSVVSVTSDTKAILGVTTTVVRDRVFVGGELVEETFDWFAQDRFGNVWYLGEDSADYEDGRVVSTAGSWEAGVDGAQPGIVMLGDPRVGDAYRQEFLEGEAEDLGEVVELGATVEVPHGAFDDVLVTEDRTPLEPDVLERKYYAPGVGVVLEELVRGGEEVLRLTEVQTRP